MNIRLTAFTFLISLLSLICLMVLGQNQALAKNEPKGQPTELHFIEMYSGGGVLGLQFSQKVQDLKGKEVVIKGFMAPPLKAEAPFFVLTREPVALCPFCSSDADWPDNILVVFLRASQAFVQNNAVIEVRGILEVGTQHDEETGFVSRVRLRNAEFKKI